MQPIYEKLHFEALRILVAHFIMICWGADSLRILVPFKPNGSKVKDRLCYGAAVTRGPWPGGIRGGIPYLKRLKPKESADPLRSVVTADPY